MVVEHGEKWPRAGRLVSEATRLAWFMVTTMALGVAMQATATGETTAMAMALALPAAWGAVVLVRIRRGLWLPYSTALFVVTIAFHLLTDAPLTVRIAYGLANLCQSVIFAWLVERYCPSAVRPDRIGHVGRLLLVSAGSSVVAGTVLTIGLIIGPTTAGGVIGSVAIQDAVMLGVVKAGADLLGLMTLVPAAFFGVHRLVASLGWSWILGWATTLGVALWVGFEATPITYSYLPLGLALLAIGQSGIEGAALIQLLLVPAATALTTTGSSPWGVASLPYARPLVAQGYGLTVSIAALLVGALVSERRGALTRLTRANEILEAMVAERTRDLAERNRRSAALADLNQSLAEARPDEDTIWQTVADQVRGVVDDVCVVRRVNPGAPGLTVVAVDERDPNSVRTTRDTFPSLHPPGRRPDQHPDQHALAVVPVRDAGEVLGTLTLYRRTEPGRSRQTGASSPDDVSFLEEVARRTSQAVVNARLRTRAEVLARRLEGLMDADAVGIFVVENDHIREANDAFLTIAGRDRLSLDAEGVPWETILLGSPTCPELIRLREQGRAKPHRETLQCPDGSTVPLLLAGARLGDNPGSWIGLAIDRSQAQSAEQALARRAAHAEILANCSQLAQGTGALDEDALNQITRQVADRIGGGLAILLDQDGRVRTAGFAHADPAIVGALRRVLDQEPPVAERGPITTTIASGQPLLATVDPAGTRPQTAAEWADSLDQTAGSSVAYLPLHARGKVLGIIFAQRSPCYLPDEFDFLSDLAENLALAIDNGRLQQAERIARTELAASEERFRTALDAMVDPVMMMTAVHDGVGAVTGFRVTYVNSAHVAARGLPRGAFLTQRDIRLTTPLPLLDELRDVLATGRPLHWDRAHWQLANQGPGTRYSDVRGIRVGQEVLVSWRDVTAQVRAEQHLADSEERLRLAFDEAPVGAALISLEANQLGCLLKINRALCELTGYPSDALTGADVTLITHPDQRAAERIGLTELASGSRDHLRQERRLVRADGSMIWARVTASVIRLDHGAAYAVEHVEDITDRRRAERELVFRALHDPLTGLGNRHLLMDRLDLALQQLSRRDGAIAVLYLDLDRFKQINDALGHDAGDEVLRRVGARLKATVRAPDTAARIGGDEFVVISTHLADETEALSIAERIRAALADPVVVAGRPVTVTASIGIVTSCSPTADPVKLLHRADLAMYQSKQHRQGDIAVYSNTLRDLTLQRDRIERDLRTALDNGWFRLHYQPIIDVADLRIVSAEALLRIDHPDRGLLLPEEFIDIAEDSELIHPIGAWVIDQATAALATWRAIDPGITVAVNISGRQTRRPGVMHQVLAAVRKASTDPSGLSVEVTERTLIHADESVIRDLNQLADLGVALALDDFGTGYSSLTYVKHLPVRIIKVDRSFVSGLGKRSDDTAIVAAVTALADALDLITVGEGVEHPHQLDALRRLGCHHAQGFYFCRPVSPEQFTHLLTARGELPAARQASSA